MKKVFVLEFDGWDSPVSYYFSTREKAEDFATKHKSKYRWVIHSYPVDRQRICKYDTSFFLNTKLSRKLAAIDKERKERE